MNRILLAFCLAFVAATWASVSGQSVRIPDPEPRIPEGRIDPARVDPADYAIDPLTRL